MQVKNVDVLCTVLEIRCDWDSSGVVVAFIRYKVCANGCGPIFVFAGLWWGFNFAFYLGR